MPLSRLRIVLAAVGVAWVATAILDGKRLVTGYSLSGSIAGEAPVSHAIQFSFLHKLAVVLLAGGIIAGVTLAWSRRNYGFTIAFVSAAATLAVSIWSVREYGLFGAPFSLWQFVALLGIVVVSNLARRKSGPTKDAGNAT